jgi:hypothetical protein
VPCKSTISSSWTAAFFPYDALGAIRRQSAQFLLRVSQQVAGFAQRTQRLGRHEWIVRFRPTAATRRKSPAVPAELYARLIRYQKPGFRPSYLLTSLRNAKHFPREELVDLYHRRWQIETIYREWKHGLDIQNLRSHTPRGILKEIHAHLLLSNLVRWVMTEASAGTGGTAVELSFLTTLSHLKNALADMLHLPPLAIATAYWNLLQAVRAAQIRQRPGRSYPRPGDGKIKNMGHGKYRLPARLPKR